MWVGGLVGDRSLFDWGKKRRRGGIRVLHDYSTCPHTKKSGFEKVLASKKG